MEETAVKQLESLFRSDEVYTQTKPMRRSARQKSLRSCTLGMGVPFSLRVSASAQETKKRLSPRGCFLGLGHS